MEEQKDGENAGSDCVVHENRHKSRLQWRTPRFSSVVTLTWMGGCMAAMGWSMEVNAEMADIRTSSLTRTFPCTRVWVRGDCGTVM